MASKMIVNREANKNVSRLIKSVNLGITNAQPKMPDGAQFGFKATLNTNEVVLHNESFDMEFEIPFDDDMLANEAEFTLYNLTTDTISKFKIGNTISMVAGYASDTGIIFDGFISKVKTVREGVDKITTVYALDDVKYTPQMMKEKTYAANTKASTILKDLLSIIGLPVAVFKPQRDYTYKDETKIDGRIIDNIKKYSEVCGISTYIHKQKIYSRSIKDGDNLSFNVNSDTGMIDSPEPYEEENQSENYVDKISGYNVSMILQHRISTAGIVNLDSIGFQGECRIQSGVHSYDGLSATTSFKGIVNIETQVEKEEK